MSRNTGARVTITGALALREGFASRSLTGDVVLTVFDSQFQRIDPNGAARNVDLPGAAGEHLQDGEFFAFVNIGTTSENLIVRQTGAGATVVTVTPGDLAIVYWVESSRTWALFTLSTDGWA